MKKLIPLLALVFLLALPGQSRAQVWGNWVQAAHSHELYKELTAKRGSTAPDEFVSSISRRLAAHPDADTAKAIAAFLSDNSFGLTQHDKVDIDYFLLYSDANWYLARITVPAPERLFYLQQSLWGLFLFEAMAMADGARCTDTTAWPAYKAEVLSPRLGRLQSVYGAYTPDQYQKLIAGTLAYEESYLDRPRNPAICVAGTGPPPKSLDEMFVDPYTWANKHDEVRELLPQFWNKRYADAGKADQKKTPQ
jgi:hypothetical protein